MTSVEKRLPVTDGAQETADAMLVSCAGQRARLKVACGEECLEYVGRVPRASEMRQWPAGQKFGAACILARPGSLDPANPISPQVQYLKIIDGEWCLVRMRLQDSEPLEIRRLGKDIQVMIEALDDR